MSGAPRGLRQAWPGGGDFPGWLGLVAWGWARLRRASSTGLRRLFERSERERTKRVPPRQPQAVRPSAVGTADHPG